MLTWSTDFTETLDWSEAPFARWFVGGEPERGRELHRPARRGGRRRPGGHLLRGRARRPPHDHLRRA
nr:acetyl-coenzyme A synthetase N-terminal domain-containing protein [Angustibacter aerolatus]